MTGLRGALMVCGTGSDSGKTTVVTGLCRLLARRGVSVAPFKAQNMALNSVVTASGHEIGRAQAAQAAAAGVEPEVAMNPILLKPTSDRKSQVIVLGRPLATLDAADYHALKPKLWETVSGSLRELLDRFDVVICEGAGSPAEINLLEHDLVNLRIAREFGMPALVVGDIDRGGVFAALLGTVELLPDDLRRAVAGFVINKFRGDPSLLSPGPEMIEARTGVPTLGVLPWIDSLDIDPEDSLALAGRGRRDTSESNGDEIDAAVIRFPRISNFTDLDALGLEASVDVRWVEGRSGLGTPDLLVLPGTKATVADLEWLRRTGLAEAIVRLARSETTTVVGICGGYQMLGEKIEDGVEAATPVVVAGLGLLGATTVFQPDKTTRRRTGLALGQRVTGYEIHHGRTAPSSPWLSLDDADGAEPEGSSGGGGRILGTSLHGLFESDGFRRAFLQEVARRAGRHGWRPGDRAFESARQARFDRIADVLEEHLDIAAIERLVASASPPSGTVR